jgi:WD40 repeat protein
VARRGLYLYSLKDGTSRPLAPEPRFQFVVSRDESFGVGLTGNLGDGTPTVELVRFRLDGGAPQTLSSHGNRVYAVALDPSETLVATGSIDGTVRVGPIGGEEPHVFFGHESSLARVAFSPDGRWLASAGNDRTIRLWPVPDVSKPPLHTLPHEALLRELRSRTNVRVVPDPGSPTGFKLDRDPFPGWGMTKR